MPLPQTEVLPQAGRLLLTDLAYLPASFQPGPSCAGTLGSQCKVGKHTQLAATPLSARKCSLVWNPGPAGDSDKLYHLLLHD